MAARAAPPPVPLTPSARPAPRQHDDGGSTSPSRNDGVTIRCPICGRDLQPVGRRQFCSAACRQAAWRRRRPLPVSLAPPRPARAPRTATVYECPSCGTRLLGEQRCADCGVFCRRVGPGGRCPHCDEPVAVADLIPQDGT